MAAKDAPENPVIRLGEKLGETFEALQHRIRERAYHLSSERGADLVDPLGDWLDAQEELLTLIDLQVKEQKNNVVVEGDLKGFSPEEIEIELEGDVLKVFGSHKESSSKKKGGSTESLSRSSCFFQSVQLPTTVNLEASQAKLFKNGKLKVTLPKS